MLLVELALARRCSAPQHLREGGVSIRRETIRVTKVVEKFDMSMNMQYAWWLVVSYI